MTRPKLIFDECLGRPYVHSLRDMASLAEHDPDVEIVHFFDEFDSSVWDEVWIPAVAKLHCVVISADRGKGGKKKGEKLPRVCLNHGVRHVLLTPGLHAQKMFDKMRAIVSVWAQLMGVFKAPRGARYKLEPTGTGTGRLIFKPPPNWIPPPDDDEPLPGTLF